MVQLRQCGRGVNLVGVDDDLAKSGQSNENRLLFWGFDADSDPGYGGVGKEWVEPLDWTAFTGLEFWFYGSGEGGELQIEIGEDKTLMSSTATSFLRPRCWLATHSVAVFNI